MLEIDGLVAHYGRIAALHGISLTVEQGEIVGLLGPNGAGKSTTLATITGLLRPTAGTIAFKGEPLAGRAPERIVRLGIAAVPEGREIFGTLTVAENLQLGMTVRQDRTQARRDLDGLLERFPILGTYYHGSAAALSGGEQQQLAIARALLSKPELLLLDEPSLGLAPLMIDLVFEILGELRDEGVTILLVEQNAARAVELADRSYVLRTGSISFSGSRERLLAEEDFAAAYLGA
jgi:branched-chain amino acid transport system ATP-binding protein